VAAPPAAPSSPTSGLPLPPAPAPPKAPEPPKELEEDEASDTRPRITESSTFLPRDTTLNVLQSAHSNVLMALTDCNMQYFVAGARANTGLKAGRYMFEVKIVEILNPIEPRGPQARTWVPRQMLRIGFATSSSKLFLGDGKENCCFDSDGNFVYDKKATPVAGKFQREQVLSVVLNLDPNSANANTVSIFKDGQRMCQPQPLPEDMKGKPLFPAVTYRNLTVHVNLGPTAMAKLPFTCRMVQEAAKSDAEMAVSVAPKNGKHEVLYPVCLPDQGTFDWLDHFLEKNPDYTELSDRKILEWAEASGIFRSRPYSQATPGFSKDRPDLSLGQPMLDEFSIRSIMRAIAPTLQRNLVVMEVKGNLLKDERARLLKPFNLPHLRRVAQVMVGDPERSFKERMQAAMLREKQEAANIAFKLQQAEAAQKRLLAKRQRQLEKEQQRLAKKQKLDEEAAANKAAEQATDGEKPSEAADDEKKEEEKADDASADEDKDEPMQDAQPPVVELSPEEKKQVFRPSGNPDLTAQVFSSCFANFTLPVQEEGFDEVRFEWDRKNKSADFMKEWMLDKKLTTRIDDLVPSQEFMQRYTQWQQQFQSWRQKQHDWQEEQQRKAVLRAEAKARREAERKAAQEKKAAEEKRAAEEKKAAEERKAEEEKKAEAEKDAAEDRPEGEEKAPEEGKAAGEKAAGEGEKPDEPMEPSKAAGEAGADAKTPNGEPKPEEAKEEDQDDDDAAVQDDDVDVFAVSDISDVGKGQPLFARFALEDWALVSLRFELHALVHGFRKDVKDVEREGIHLDHILFYYNKYFHKTLLPSSFGRDTFESLLALVSDSISLSPKKALQSHLSDELDSFDVFVKLAEEGRRERNLLVDLGDESAALKLSAAAAASFAARLQPNRPAPRPGFGGSSPTHGGGYGAPSAQQWPAAYGAQKGGYGGAGFGGQSGLSAGKGGYGGYGGGYSSKGYGSAAAQPYGKVGGDRRPYYGKGGYK